MTQNEKKFIKEHGEKAYNKIYHLAKFFNIKMDLIIGLKKEALQILLSPG